MKLYPKARPVRIKLNVGGEEHSSLDTLRANFNVEEVLQLYASGGLQNWLRQINRLDILDQLDKIQNNSIVEKYRKCILIFFEYANKHSESVDNDTELSRINMSMDSILMKWYDLYPKSFRYLLSHIIVLSPEEYCLSVKNMMILGEKSRKANDVDLRSMLEKYLFNHVKRTLTIIRDLRFKAIKDAEAYDDALDDYEYHVNADYRINVIKKELSEQLSSEWNLDLDQILKAEIDVEKELYVMLKNDLLNDNGLVLREILNQIKADHELSHKGFSISDRSQLNEKIQFLGSVVQDIQTFKVRIYVSKARLDVLSSDNTKPWNLMIWNIWYRLPGIIENFKDISNNTQLIDKWGLLVIHIYLYKTILESYHSLNLINKVDYNCLYNFLDDCKGRQGMPILLDKIYQQCNKSSIEDTKGVRRKILQSALFIGVLGDREKINNNKYLLELHETRYRPASLYLDKVKPSNNIEREFMKMNNFERIPFIAEHILDF